MAALERKGGVGDLPAVVHAAHDVVLRSLGVGEEDLTELGGAIGLGDATHLDTRLLHRHEDVRDAGVLGGVGIGAGEQEAVVGVVTLGRPHLLAVDDPLIAVEHGRRLDRREVGAGIRLREPLAPPRLSLQDAREELLLLLFAPPLQERRSDERVTEEVAAHRRLGAGELFGERDALHRGEALAAVLRGPGGADPAALEQLLRPVGVEPLAFVVGQLEAVVEPAHR